MKAVQIIGGYPLYPATPERIAALEKHRNPLIAYARKFSRKPNVKPPKITDEDCNEAVFLFTHEDGHSLSREALRSAGKYQRERMPDDVFGLIMQWLGLLISAALTPPKKQT